MSERGVKFMYGRWLIEGAPRVLLFDTSSVRNRLDEWKTDLWNLAAIPTPSDDQETNETILLGYLTTWFLGEVGPCRVRRASRWFPSSPRPPSRRRWPTTSRLAPSSLTSTSGKLVRCAYLCAGPR